MKKWIPFLVLGLATMACSDDDEDNGPGGLTGRMIGTWDMTSLTYATSIPNPFDPFNPINAAGDATGVQGVFNVRYNPAQNLDYDYEFTIDDDDLLFPIPINRTGQANWQVLANNTKVMLIEDGETVIYDVIINDPNRQVWSGVIPFTISALSITVDTDIQFTLERR
jgi:hypothetical protein